MSCPFHMILLIILFVHPRSVISDAPLPALGDMGMSLGEDAAKDTRTEVVHSLIYDLQNINFATKIFHQKVRMATNVSFQCDKDIDVLMQSAAKKEAWALGSE